MKINRLISIIFLMLFAGISFGQYQPNICTGYYGHVQDVLDTANAPGYVLTSNSGAKPTWQLISSSQGISQSVLANDTITASTTLVNTPLTFVIGASETWTFHIELFPLVDSVQGMKVAITSPTSSTLLANAKGATTAVTASKEDLITTSGTATVAFNTAVGSTAGLCIDGIVKNSTTAGNVRLQFESISGGGNVKIKALSYIKSSRVQ